MFAGVACCHCHRCVVAAVTFDRPERQWQVQHLGFDLLCVGNLEPVTGGWLVQMRVAHIHILSTNI